jgi:putative CocE/NonD family hydrolase
VTTSSPGLPARTIDRVLRRLRKLPAPRNGYVVERDLRTPTRDGFVLVGDHYAPTGSARGGGTVLVRTPYGRGAPVAQLWGSTFAARGYHVFLQSCRGTGGSTGTFEPMVREADDAKDTVAWLREQPWFSGDLATMGMSYVAFTQWGLLADPPPELRASVLVAGPHDFGRAVWDNDAFALETFLAWSATNSVPFEDRPGLFQQLTGDRQRAKRLASAFPSLPMADAAESVLNGRAPWYRQWLAHPDLSDAYWRPYDHTEALQRVQTPTLLVGGWQDVFVGQTVQQYEVLRSRGIDVALTLGPWTHVAHVVKGSAVIDNEALDWLDTHLGKRGPRRRPQPVHTFVTGSGTWHHAETWPPKGTETNWHPHDGGLLATTVPSGGRSVFRFDPSDPTPTVGGRRLASGAGVRTNNDLEARPDVLTFTTPALAADLEFEGFPVAEVSVSVDNPHADLFVRICDVDKKGRSHNISDTLVRLDPTVAAGEVQRVTARLSPCAHRVLAGHRLRLQLSGGAHPQYARNLGTGEDLPTGTGQKPAVHTIDHVATRLTLPVTTRAATTPRQP